jgi:putative transposase
MFLTPYSRLKWAYQLHYYLCFRTHRRRLSFETGTQQLIEIVNEICGRHEFHLLKCQPRPDQLRFLLSLQPAQAIANVMKTIKTNSSREACIQLGLRAPVWARGYLAKSVGRMRIDAVRNYLDQQPKHHGYDSRILPPVYRYRAEVPRVLEARHSFFDLNHHVVIATKGRRGVFTSDVGRALSEYWLKVAAARNFAIDQISMVPDHVHLLIRITPKMSIEECVLSLMNNGQHFIGQNFPQVMIELGLDQLWEPSAYAGTCGEVTTALLKTWLSERD